MQEQQLEENGKQRLTLSVEPKIVTIAKVLAAQKGVTLSALFEEWVEEKQNEENSK